MSVPGNLLLINNVQRSSRRLSHIVEELYVPYEQDEENVNDRRVSMTTAQINENVKFINNLKTWAKATKETSKTATGKGIARLVEKIANDGRVDIEDENLILETMSVQRSWWATLIMMDTLICALTTAMLNYEQLPDNGHWSKEAGERILFAYHTVLSVLLYFTNVHLVVLLLLSGLSTFIFEVKGVLTFFVQCHTLMVHVNFSGMLFWGPGCLMVPALAQTYSYGIYHALPSIILACTTLAMMFMAYVRVLKPLFIGLYNEEYDIGSTWEPTNLKKSVKETA